MTEDKGKKFFKRILGGNSDCGCGSSWIEEEQVDSNTEDQENDKECEKTQ